MPRLLSSCLLTSVLCLSCLAAAAGQTSQPLRVQTSGPNGEVASLAEAGEIRVVFSEPMVTLGRIPDRVTAPFFRVTPAIAGTFRWAGTTMLIFTPDPKRPLPYATKYDITIDTTATAVSGRRLATPHRFTFTTPTVKLLETNWYRRGGRAGAPMVILLSFNQPVRPADVLPHLRARFARHAWDEPVLPADGAARLKTIDPAAVQRFTAKVAAVRAVTQSEAPIAVALTADWDRKQFPARPELIVLETKTEVPPQAHVRVEVGAGVPSPAGSATPQSVGQYTIEAEPAFFVRGFDCVTGCAADRGNALEFLAEVRVASLAAALQAVDVTDPARPVPAAKAKTPRPREDFAADQSTELSLEDAGFERQPPARTYAVTVPASLRSADGQTLGYTWSGTVENWHETAFTSFGDGHGVWERTGGTLLPFYARNFQRVTQWAQPVALPQLMPTLLALQDPRSGPAFAAAPAAAGEDRKLAVTPDRIQSHGLDLSKAVGAGTFGLVWAAVREGAPIARASRAVDRDDWTRATLVQVTNLGITVKDSPQNTLIFVTSLADGSPVPGARVSIVNRLNAAVWRGATGADGVALAPKTSGLRNADNWWELSFIVTAEKDGDVAYVASDWNEGITPWSFNLGFDLDEAAPLLRGTVFSDRGVYRLGEEVHLKAVVRHNTPQGIRLLPAGTPIIVTIRDGQDRVIDERTVKANEWSTAEWRVTLPAEGSLGGYSIRALLESDRPRTKPGTADDPGAEQDDWKTRRKAVHGSFLVAAYRRPDFRVDVALQNGVISAGDRVKGTVAAKYLFGAPMPGRPATWTWTRAQAWTAPQAVLDALPDADRWTFVGEVERRMENNGVVETREVKTARTGEIALDLPTALDAGVPYAYTLEADVEDVSRQHIANRATLVVHPAPWYVGVRRPAYFVDQKTGLDTEIVTISPEGRIVAGVPVEVTLTQIQWTSVRRAEGNGFYTWDTERKQVPVGTWTVTSGEKPAPLRAAIPNGGYFELEATARDASGRSAITKTSFYVIGAGYTAWERFDHNRINLVADKPRYKPGDTAQIMIQSPWERATALITTEREGIRTHRQITLGSTQQSVAIPITDDDIPNVYVSVLLVRGRVAAPAGNPADAPSGGPFAVDDPSDPGRPAFRLGYLELKVEDRSKRLTVAVSANREEYRPATDAQVQLAVTDSNGKPAQSEVTLWAVDYGVLSLTAYRTPDVLGSVYVEKALQVMNSDSRQRIVSRRVLTPKGDTEGGGGGAEGSGMRRDFRVLAFWIGSVATDAAGRATVSVKLPESLTTYRIMAVAGDRLSRFGNGDAEVRVNKPLTMKPTFPRFLAVGDTAQFGAVVTSQLKDAGEATVTIRSLDPQLLEIRGGAEQTAVIPPGGSIEPRFTAVARGVGRARLQMTARMGTESDSFEDVIPVQVLVSPETVAAHGQLAGDSARATETLTLPAGVVPGFGGLHVEMSSTAMVGLGEGARYLVEYPFGCAEQRASRTLALSLAADLGDAFSLPGIEPAGLRTSVQQSLKELERYQCSSGGFAYWPGNCTSVSPYLTSYLLHTFRVARDLKYTVDAGVLQRAYAYLDTELAAPQPTNESWMPAYTAWQAFAVRVLVEGGRNQDSNLTRLYGYRDRMPVFALAYLHDALAARGETTGARIEDLRRRMTNAILPEASSAHVEELSDPYLLHFWSSNVRSTAIVLSSLTKARAPIDQIRPLVRWMMAARKKGRWGNTQENAHAMQALVAYYRQYEAVVPDFTGVVMLGEQELAREQFRGRTTDSRAADLPMVNVLASGAANAPRPLTVTRDGSGTLFYSARLRYAADQLFQRGLDNGINVERSYAPFVENATRPAATTYKAGDLVRVTLTLRLTKERRFVAVTDPLPAGFEPLESWFATSARAIDTSDPVETPEGQSWQAWWQRGGFDHVERHDDRVQLFATRLSEGTHTYTYVARATTAGTFRTAPARAEEMYEPEVFGRTATAVITVQR